MFYEIWDEREHVSAISGIQLDQYAKLYFFNMFAHILCKKDYPKMRLFKRNIMLLTPEEHAIQDSIDKRKKYTDRIFREYGVIVRWELFDKMHAELKEFYDNEFESKIVKRDFNKSFRGF